MKKYRVIKKTYLDGTIYYRVQVRVFYFFWTNINPPPDFYFRLRITNICNQNTNHPANLVGLWHENFIDALEEISFHESNEKKTTIKKNEVVG